MPTSIWLFLWLLVLLLLLATYDVYECSPYDPNESIRTSAHQQKTKQARTYQRGGDQSLVFTQDDIHLLKEGTRLSIVALVQRVTQLFDEQGLTYWMCAGSWLGSIRHRGLIPWDDDTDMHVLESELPKLKELHQVFWDRGLKVYRRADSHCLRICSRYRGHEYPCVDLALMREVTVATFKLETEHILPVEVKARLQLDQADDSDVLLQTVPVGPKRLTDPFYYAKKFNFSFEVVQPHRRIFPLIRAPFEHFQVWCAKDDTLLDQMYPGFRIEARTDSTGLRQMFVNHALYYRLPHRGGTLLKDIDITAHAVRTSNHP
jgi:hypothetical protein